MNSSQSAHPPYFAEAVVRCYEKFCAELAGKDLVDPRGDVISILEVNFPKLLNVKLRGSSTKAKASLVLADLRKGIFSAALYAFDRDRLETLFWIPDVIERPDSIHKNAHPRVEGEEVYVKQYQKMGRTVKLVFVKFTYAGQRVVTTSFLTDPERIPLLAEPSFRWRKT